MPRLTVRRETFAYAKPFRISGHVFTETALVVAELSDGTHIGRGEGAGAYHLRDDADAMAPIDAARVAAVRAARADCWIGADADQGYTIGGLPALVDMLLAHDVALLEQPRARGREADMDELDTEGFDRRMPIAAARVPGVESRSGDIPCANAVRGHDE